MNLAEANAQNDYDNQINDYYDTDDKVRFPGEDSKDSVTEFDAFVQACGTDNFHFIDDYLIENFDAKDEMGTIILRFIFENGSKKVLERLFSLFPEWNMKVAIGELESIPLFLFACKFATHEIVLWLATKLDSLGERLADIKDEEGSNALHYACQGNHVEVVKHLIDVYHFYINCEDKWGRLPIYFACKRDMLCVEIILYLLCHGSLVENIDKTGDGIIDIIVFYFDNDELQRLAVEDVEFRKQKRRTDQHIIEICYACLLNDHLGQRENAADIFKSIMKSDNLPLVSLAFLKYLPYLKNPIRLLNAHFVGQDHTKIGEPDAEDELFMNAKTLDELHKFAKKNEFSKWFTIFQQYLHYSPYQHMILHYIIQILYGLHMAMENNPNELSDLDDIRRKFEIMINEIFTSNALDSLERVALLLLPLKFPQNQQKKSSNVQMNMVDNKFRDTFHDEDSIIRLCLDHDIITLFDKPQINTLFSRVFYSSPKPSSAQLVYEQTFVYSIYAWSFYLLYDNTSNIRRNEHRSRGKTLSDLTVARNAFVKKIRFSHILPSMPAIVMFTEFVSKSMLLVAVANLSVPGYAYHYQLDYSSDANPRNDPDRGAFQHNEYLLIVLATADIVFEIGQIIQQKRFSWKDQDEWNCLDLFSSSLVMIWIFLRYATKHYFPVGRAVLALSAIPMSFGLLRYLSVYKPLGELVILIRAMGSAIFSFVIIYFFSIMGFGITFLSLFYKMTDGYSTPGFTFLTLIQNTLLNFTFDDFITPSYAINTLGIVLLLMFLILTALILMNLLIAQMSSSYNDMKAKSQKQWSFNFAKLAGQYVSNKEDHNLLCLFPPPFNLLGFVLGVVNIVTENNFQFSLGQTINNFCCSSVLGSIVRFYLNTTHFCSMLFERIPILAEDKEWSIVYMSGFYILYSAIAITLILLDVLVPFYGIGMELYCLWFHPKFCPSIQQAIPSTRVESTKRMSEHADRVVHTGNSSPTKTSRKQSELVLPESTILPDEINLENAYRDTCLYLKFLNEIRVPFWKRILLTWKKGMNSMDDRSSMASPRRGSLQTISKWRVSKSDCDDKRKFAENFALQDQSLEIFHLYEHSELLLCLDTEDDDIDSSSNEDKRKNSFSSSDKYASHTVTMDSSESDLREKTMTQSSKLSTSTIPTSERIFKNEDIERILHPLKSYIRSLGSDETIRLENNIANENRKLKQELEERLDDHLKKIVFIEKMMYSAITGNHQVFAGSKPPTPTAGFKTTPTNASSTIAHHAIPTTVTTLPKVHGTPELRRNESIRKATMKNSSSSSSGNVRFNSFNIPFLKIGSRDDSVFKSSSCIEPVSPTIAALNNKTTPHHRWQSVKIALKMKNAITDLHIPRALSNDETVRSAATTPKAAASSSPMVAGNLPHHDSKLHSSDMIHMQHRMDKMETLMTEIHSMLSLMSQQKLEMKK